MSHQDNSVFVDASGRRGRTVRWAAAGVGVACLGFLAVVVAGSFGAGPAGGPLPWADDEQRDAPALIQPDATQSGDSDGAPQRTATPSAAPRTSDASATATPSAATTPSPTPTGGTAGTTAPPAPTAAPGGGTGGSDTGDGPGKADEAPGATKRPK
ncbi:MULTISPECIES: hypothetical protein [Streptomyces]|uniref:Uncharacterized protein n=1 Tax=Streptomyces viridochromogenes TaxID=1938 RepID=A0A0L8JM86_STRVR|nr:MULTISPECIES: hypothetical protein [Streptomyces]KOG14752.1 hypothetical protein ADK34_28385 [Streptomyces viridochromogenes]